MSERPKFTTRVKDRLTLLRNEWVYNRLPFKDETVLNYGYQGSENLTVDPKEQHLRNRLQLYYHVVSGVDIENKDVLEVGSGRGRGAYFVAIQMHPKSLKAIDLSSKSVEFAQEHYEKEGLEYSVGNASNLPFADESFDVAINIESSHWYPNTQAFFAEIKRVLKPKGHFLFADSRRIQEVSATEAEIRRVGLTIRSVEDITQNVVKALDSDNEYKAGVIKKGPAGLGKPISVFAGMKGSSMYRSFVEGRRAYMNYVVQKEA